MNIPPSVENFEALAGLESELHLAIGVFDGVHLGHKAVVESAVFSARRSKGVSAVLTFDPHPSRLFELGRYLHFHNVPRIEDVQLDSVSNHKRPTRVFITRLINVSSALDVRRLAVDIDAAGHKPELTPTDVVILNHQSGNPDVRFAFWLPLVSDVSFDCTSVAQFSPPLSALYSSVDTQITSQSHQVWFFPRPRGKAV